MCSPFESIGGRFEMRRQNRHLAALQGERRTVAPHRGQVLEQMVLGVRPCAAAGLPVEVAQQVRAIARLQTADGLAVDAQAAGTGAERVAELSEDALDLQL